jgi:hypothetical protein
MRGTEARRWEDAAQDAVRDAGMDERMTVAGAAEHLGITKEAVRKRIHRGTLRSDKDPDGTVMVYIPLSGKTDGTPISPSGGASELLYEVMRERIAYLERQVEEERDARRRGDTLLARLMDRVPELEAPQRFEERQERPEEPRSSAVGGAQEGAEQLPWWRKMFG